MAWITLSLRKQELKSDSNELEMQIISKSREVRQIQRNLAYQKAIVQAEESAQLHNVKEDYKAAKAKRPTQITINDTIYYFETNTDYLNWKEKHTSKSAKPAKGTKGLIGSKDLEDDDNTASKKYAEKYSEWKDNQLDAAKERYQEQKTYIEDMADDEKEMLEEEATEKQSQIEEEKTILESNLEDINQELQSVGEQIGTDIQSSVVKFS